MTKNNETRIELTISGMPEEKVKVILEFDHQAELSDRYWNEAKDWGMEKMKASIDFKDDPIDCIADRGPEVHDLAFPAAETLDPRVEALYKAMGHLSEEQVDLIYDIFGSCRSLEEIAEEAGVTRQAIYDRKRRIVNKLRKLMEG